MPMTRHGISTQAMMHVANMGHMELEHSRCRETLQYALNFGGTRPRARMNARDVATLIYCAATMRRTPVEKSIAVDFSTGRRTESTRVSGIGQNSCLTAGGDLRGI